MWMLIIHWILCHPLIFHLFLSNYFISAQYLELFIRLFQNLLLWCLKWISMEKCYNPQGFKDTELTLWPTVLHWNIARRSCLNLDPVMMYKKKLIAELRMCSSWVMIPATADLRTISGELCPSMLRTASRWACLGTMRQRNVRVRTTVMIVSCRSVLLCLWWLSAIVGLTSSLPIAWLPWSESARSFNAPHLVDWCLWAERYFCWRCDDLTAQRIVRFMVRMAANGSTPLRTTLDMEYWAAIWPIPVLTHCRPK